MERAQDGGSEPRLLRLSVTGNPVPLSECSPHGKYPRSTSMILAPHYSILPSTANFCEAYPECDPDYIPNRSREQCANAALSNSFACLNAVAAFCAAPWKLPIKIQSGFGVRNRGNRGSVFLGGSESRGGKA